MDILIPGAPATFPIQEENRVLHKYLVWSDHYEQMAVEFMRQYLYGGAYLGLHLRNGIDWVRACSHIPESPSLFSAPQCLGYKNEEGEATREMCLPSKDTIIRQVKQLIKYYNGLGDRNKVVKFVFVASDSNHMLEELASALRTLDVTVVSDVRRDPHLDLVILAKSNHFIGNCISSYSSFVKRERDVWKFPTSFWGHTPKKNLHQEL